MVATWMTGKRQVTREDTSLRFTDAYVIEIFGSNGALVDTIPLTHFAGSIDKYLGMHVYQCRIISNK